MPAKYDRLIRHGRSTKWLCCCWLSRAGQGSYAAFCVRQDTTGAGPVPEGQPKIAQRFSVGSAPPGGHKSRRDGRITPGFSAVPSGLVSFRRLYPTLKRWAIVGRPSGTSTQETPRWRATGQLFCPAPIRLYCARNGITIPPGFARHAPSRYAIIRTHLTPPRLIATTWFKTADVIYYIEHFLLTDLGPALPQAIRILDFQDAKELAYTGAKRLDTISTFPIAPP